MSEEFIFCVEKKKKEIVTLAEKINVKSDFTGLGAVSVFNLMLLVAVK